MADQDQSSLLEAVSQYEMQLTQIKFAIDATSHGPDRENLISLQKDIEELINLTKENLKSLQGHNGEGSSKQTGYIPEEEDDPFAKEYALFKAELASSEAENGNSSVEASYVPVDIQSDLQELQGMKCQAPHSHQWGGDESYHNALVYGVEPSEDITDVAQIQVRVMFTNPTHQEMLPCPYFLEGECRFSETQCRFSHGEVVQLSCLKEYREPDFSLVRQGSRVLVKQSDKLWHRAIITTMHPKNRCEVKFESSRGKAEVDLHDILPMSADKDGECESGDSSDGDLSEEEAELTASLVEQSLLVTPLSTALGSWEEYTRGIGSRLMAQMGYVTGAGLGKYGEGRIEPIEAVVLPAGKSLDHCMALREQAGGDTNLFKVDRRMRRLQRKQDLKREKQYEAEKQRTRTDVFDFINTTLGGKRERVQEVSSQPTSSKASSAELSPSKPAGTVLKTESSRGLNVVGFQVSEEIRRAERDLAKLQESLARHSEGSMIYKTITSKFQDKQGELSHLRASEKSIDQERSQRSDRKKLSVF